MPQCMYTIADSQTDMPFIADATDVVTGRIFKDVDVFRASHNLKELLISREILTLDGVCHHSSSGV